jgi:hypothetical protein
VTRIPDSLVDDLRAGTRAIAVNAAVGLAGVAFDALEEAIATRDWDIVLTFAGDSELVVAAERQRVIALMWELEARKRKEHWDAFMGVLKATMAGAIALGRVVTITVIREAIEAALAAEA